VVSKSVHERVERATVFPLFSRLVNKKTLECGVELEFDRETEESGGRESGRGLWNQFKPEEWLTSARGRWSV
jgi:hypothetical protein